MSPAPPEERQRATQPPAQEARRPRSGAKDKRLVALSSVLAAIGLTTFKIVVGLFTGSLGILAEAAHSGLDLVAALMTFFAVRVADRPADATHPYGHGKVENLSAFLEGGLLIITAAWVIYEAVRRLLYNEGHINPSFWAFLVMGISIVVDATRSRALMKVAKEQGSQALEADALHFRTDIWSSAVVIAGLTAVKIGQVLGVPWLDRADAVAALGVSLIVLWVSFRLVKQTLDALLDRAPDRLGAMLETAALDVEGIVDVRRVRLRRAGNKLFAELVVGAPRTATFEHAHAVTEAVERAAREAVCRETPNADVDVVVHVEPAATPAETTAQGIHYLALELGLRAHDVRVRVLEPEGHPKMPLAKRIAGRAFFLLFSQQQCAILPKVRRRRYAHFLGEEAVKISCKQSDLSRGLSVVSHAVATRSTLPVLTNILMSTDDNRLKLSATNLEIGITCWVAADVIEQGSITVPARLLADFVVGLPQGVVEMSLPKGSYTLSVKSARSAANIKGMDAGEFPTIPSTDTDDPPVLLDAATLKEMISEVAFAAATDDARPMFTGVFTQVSEDKLTFASADSYRLAVRSTSLSANGHPVGDILIPARTLTELARILPSDGTVQMMVTPNRSQVLFHTEGMDLISRLIDSTFPAYQRIMPQKHEVRAVVDTGEFRAAAKSAALFARDSNNIVTVIVEQGKADGTEPGTVTLQANAEEIGDNTSLVNAAVDGKGMRIMFNVKYLTDVLAVIDTPEVALEMESAQKPGVVRPVGGTDYTYVIMPMHTMR